MTYPTLAEVEQADRVQLAQWYRYLPSPGSQVVGKPGLHDLHVAESEVLARICARFGELGGFTPQISKAISS